VAGAQAHHEPSRHDEKISAPTEKSFGVTFAVVFALLAIWFAYRSGLSTRAMVAVGLAGAFLAAAYIVPKWLAPLNWVWFRLGLALHAVVSPLILGLLFFAVVTPIGLVLRLFGKDLLRLKRSTGTYWLSRESEPPSSMINQF
jgi:hypothetical protein